MDGWIVTLMETEEGYLSGSKVSTTSAEALGSEEWARGVEWFGIITCALTEESTEKMGLLLRYMGHARRRATSKFLKARRWVERRRFAKGACVLQRRKTKRRHAYTVPVVCTCGSRTGCVFSCDHDDVRSEKVRRRCIECESEESLGPAWIRDGGNLRSDDQGCEPRWDNVSPAITIIRQVEAVRSVGHGHDDA